MEMFFAQVGNFGFPMVVAIYLLVRVEKKLDELTIAINDLGRVVEKNVP
ncbi:MAG: YvrJ family protein [Clostridia bacterium]|nr:YvrJ family protein [Clostridia bacterium]